MKKIEPGREDMGPSPRMGHHDNNRDPFSPPQTLHKVFQQYRGAQQNPPGYGMGETVPFNIDESGMPGGYHY